MNLPPDEKQWPEPTTFEEVAAQDAVRSARTQGLPDTIEDLTTIEKIATLCRSYK